MSCSFFRISFHSAAVIGFANDDSGDSAFLDMREALSSAGSGVTVTHPYLKEVNACQLGILSIIRISSKLVD